MHIALQLLQHIGKRNELHDRELTNSTVVNIQAFYISGAAWHKQEMYNDISKLSEKEENIT